MMNKAELIALDKKLAEQEGHKCILVLCLDCNGIFTGKNFLCKTKESPPIFCSNCHKEINEFYLMRVNYSGKPDTPEGGELLQVQDRLI